MPESKPREPTGKWRPVPAELAEFYHEVLRSLPEAEPRKMFGVPCHFVNGRMFTGLHQESMILRLSEADRARFLAIEGARVFEPFPGRPMRETVVVPPSVLGSPEVLAGWLRLAFDYARSLPPKPQKAEKAGVGRGR